MSRRLLAVVLVLAFVPFASACSGGQVEPTHDEFVPIAIGDSGQGSTIADSVYLLLGSMDGSWLQFKAGYDPEAHLDESVRINAAQVEGTRSVFNVLKASRVRDGDTVVQRWTFSDKSELAYWTVVDDANHRSRIATIRVRRP